MGSKEQEQKIVQASPRNCTLPDPKLSYKSLRRRNSLKRPIINYNRGLGEDRGKLVDSTTGELVEILTMKCPSYKAIEGVEDNPETTIVRRPSGGHIVFNCQSKSCVSRKKSK